MSDGNDDHETEEDAFLSKLIRASRDREKRDFTRPGKDVIVAYLMGTASEEQEREMRRALAQSEAFRREILAMANDIEALEEADFHEAADVQGATVPTRGEFLAHRVEQAVRGVKTISFLERLKDLLVPKVYIPVTVVVAVLVVVLIVRAFIPTGVMQVRDIARWSLADGDVDPAYVISNIVRGVDAGESSLVSAAPDTAALIAFRDLVKREGGEFILEQAGEEPEVPAPFRSVQLVFQDATGRVVEEVSTKLPITGTEEIQRPEAWLLTIAPWRLYRLRMTSDSLAVNLPHNLGKGACVTFTYNDGQGYRAVPGFVLEPR